jgi:integrase
LAYLKTWKKEQTQYRLSIDTWNSNNFVFTNSVGNPMEPRKATTKWAELLGKAGLAHLNLHGARHTFATVMGEEELGLKMVNYYLGHSSINTTISIYQHVSRDAIDKSAKVIGDVAM